MNNGYTYHETITHRGAERALDRYLSQRYRHSTLHQWREHILAGRVLLDGKQPTMDALLRLGQVLEWHRPPWKEPAAPLALAVLYRHAGVLVINKPAGLATMPGGGFLQHTLVYQLRVMDRHASPLHRLGRWTSGAVLCACSRSARAKLTAQFVAHAIDKRYRALASGRPARDNFDIDLPIGPVPYPPLGTVHAARSDGREAHSRVQVIERYPDSFLCDVTITTGRPHQIRIHLAAVGHPLVGDPLFVSGGRPRPDGTALPGDPGYFLHAARIAFHDPQTKQRVLVSAPPPTPRPGAVRPAIPPRPTGLP